ncbi:MAG: Fe(3+) ABC transporter substrate-binding protein [Rhodobacterales bacterium]|nr:Fe(3+) ABC transporter substrate-binding protein [Rhodobacterales bacterium]
MPPRISALAPVARKAARAAFLKLVPALALVAVAGAAAAPQARADEVNLYSLRQPFLIQPLLDAFTAKTGTKVNVVFAQKGMVERLKAEGMNSPADAILTVDIGRLNDLTEAGLLAPVHSTVLDANIPPQYRHPDGLWFGLTTRARILFASKDRVKPGELTSYDDLAKPHMKGRVCIRSGKHVYNVSLIAAVIAHKGLDGARAWLTGLRDNLARKPQGNDRAQAKAIYEGQCDVGIANTYYMGKMATNDKKPEQKKWAEAVRVVFPDQAGIGTHVNVSGAGVTKSAKNRAGAIKLLEFLSSDEAQHLYAELNLEYPVKPGIALHPLVASWGDFKADTLNLAAVAALRGQASKLVDEVRFDNGPES